MNTESEAWLAAIVDSSDDAIVGKTLDSIIRSWNGGASRMFGYSPDEVIGRSVLLLIPPRLQHEEAEIVARLKRGERIDHYETVRTRKDGSDIEVSLSVSPILSQSGEIVGAAKIARDIGEAKRLQRLERELTEQLRENAAELELQIAMGQSLRDELEQANEHLDRAVATAQFAQRAAEEANRAKSQFLAMMSHELRTPLNAIAGYVDLIELEIHGPVTDAQRDSLARIKRSGSMLLRLIENVLDFAKLESGRLEFDITDVRLDAVLETLQTYVHPLLAKGGVEYRFEPCGDGVTARGDRNKIEQIVLNLLSNAVKFTQAGRIEVRCISDGPVVRVEVSDTGSGIREDLLEAVFEPFVQGDRDLTKPAQGTGLGLSICRQLARGMGGDVTVRSHEGEGSTFTLVLPQAGGKS